MHAHHQSFVEENSVVPPAHRCRICRGECKVRTGRLAVKTASGTPAASTRKKAGDHGFINATSGLYSAALQRVLWPFLQCDSRRPENRPSDCTFVKITAIQGHSGRDISDAEEIGPPRAETRIAYASTGGNTMHEEHRKAAEQHALAAKAHRTAAEHNEKGDSVAGSWHTQRALEYSDHAYKLAKEAHNKSGQMRPL
jgi:pyruvate/2-oxoglutarate dehydrogenase complex dihydrolipoamide acyltransferase (E2) component